MSEHRYSKRRSPFLGVAAVTLLIVGGLALALGWLGPSDDADGAAVTVWCAAGIKAPVEEAARRYEDELGVAVVLNYDNSGGLLSTIEIHPSGDLYIPADATFIERGREKALLDEAIPLARFRLVLAVKPGNPRGLRSLDDLLQDDVRYVLCSEQAGAGKMTREVLEAAGRWTEIERGAKVFKPTVTDAASVVRAAADLDAGIFWDSTAEQYDLDAISLPELDSAVARIHVGVVSATEQPAEALRFARYLSAPERGGELFRKHGYEPIAGDAWAAVPELRVFCGGVNRDAVEPTLREFEKREGCEITEVYNGCGVLVGQIRASPLEPDAFLTCDASYMDMVEDLFLEARDVSSTSIVLLVRESEADRIRTLADLAGDGVRVGITDPRYSALGHLSQEILEDAGLWEQVRPNIRVEAPTAHELVLQVEAHDKLDVALVYQANCQNLEEGLRVVPVDHPRARAIQDIAVGRRTRYPWLTERLIDAVTSARSADRFRSRGFSWLVDPPER